MFGTEILTVPTVCTAAVLRILAVWFEMRTNKIPNWLSVLGLMSGIVLAGVDQLFLTRTNGVIFGAFGSWFLPPFLSPHKALESRSEKKTPSRPRMAEALSDEFSDGFNRT